MRTYNTYWTENGKYEKQGKAIKHLVPDSGEADTQHIEMLRVVTNCYYDLYNNGGGNWDGNRAKQFEYIIDYQGVLIRSAHKEGLNPYQLSELLTIIVAIMDDAWKEADYSDGCIYDCDEYEDYGFCDCADNEEYGLRYSKFDEVAKLYEKLVDIIIIYTSKTTTDYDKMINGWAEKHEIPSPLVEIAHNAFCGAKNGLDELMSQTQSTSLENWLKQASTLYKMGDSKLLELLEGFENV